MINVDFADISLFDISQTSHVLNRGSNMCARTHIQKKNIKVPPLHQTSGLFLTPY